MKKYRLISVILAIGLAGAAGVYAADNLPNRPHIEGRCAGKHHGKPDPEAHFKRLEADVVAAQSAGKISAQDAQEVRVKIAALQASQLKMQADKTALHTKLDALGLKPAKARPHDLTRHLEHISQDVDLAEKSGQLSVSDAKNVRQEILSIRTQLQQAEAAGNQTKPNQNIHAQMQVLHQQLKRLNVMPAHEHHVVF